MNYTAIENGKTSTITKAAYRAILNQATMGARRQIKSVSQISSTSHEIVYTYGRTVVLTATRVAEAPASAPAAETTETTETESLPTRALIQRRTDGNHEYGPVIIVGGKLYTAQVHPATEPSEYFPEGTAERVSYWSVRNGERFGATRSVSADSTSKVGVAIWAATH